MNPGQRRLRLLCAYSWIPFILLTGVGFWGIAGFVPPPDPGASAQEITDQFRDDKNAIRVGMCMCIFASAMLIPWGAAIAAQIRRLEGPNSFLLWGFIAANACVVLEFAFPPAVWVAASYRLDDPQIVQALNDLAWLPWLGIVCTAIVQMLFLAAVTLADDRPDPIYPRWFAYYNVWVALGVTPAGMIYIFKSGPLAWDGVFGFYIASVCGFSWICICGIMTARAVNRSFDDPLESSSSDSVENRLRAIEDRLAKEVTP